MGLGHVHRLIALGQMLRNDFDCVFLIRAPLPGIKDLILQNFTSLIEVDASLSLDEEPEQLLKYFSGNEIVVLDGYHFDTNYQLRIRKNRSQLVCIDDIHDVFFDCDVIINPAGGILPAVYRHAPFTRIFTGPAFAFLKPPFLHSKRNEANRSGKMLICMGGADADNNTLITLTQRLKDPVKSIVVILGEAYRYKASLQELIVASEKKVEVLNNLTPETLAEVMLECDVAVTSASGIAYEYLSIGGELYIKQTASNQKDLYKYLTESKLAFPYEQFPAARDVIKVSRSEQSKVFDGASGKRLLKIFKQLESSMNLAVRRAVASDVDITYRWANDPEQRRQSFRTKAISKEEHSTWFEKKIADSNTVLYIFELESLPIAQLRLDLEDGQAVISYSIDKGHRGKGLGNAVLSCGLKRFIEDRQIPVRIVGFVKKTNTSSMRIFENLRFIKTEATEYPDSFRYEFAIL
jgi:spore coat polysaccharide biosynthesis predicted glycosyltransferase SpsG/RimJ/RimL family protein N-acetyltransferase